MHNVFEITSKSGFVVTCMCNALWALCMIGCSVNVHNYYKCILYYYYHHHHHHHHHHYFYCSSLLSRCVLQSDGCVMARMTVGMDLMRRLRYVVTVNVMVLRTCSAAKMASVCVSGCVVMEKTTVVMDQMKTTINIVRILFFCSLFLTLRLLVWLGGSLTVTVA